MTLIGIQHQICNIHAKVNARVLGHMVIAAQHLHIPSGEIIDRLLADRHDNGIAAVALHLINACLCDLEDIGIESARQTAVARNHDQQHGAVLHALMHILRIEVRILGSDLCHQLVGLFKERLTGFCAFLGSPEFGRCHQLHRFRDLHGAFDGMDPPFDVLQIRHGLHLSLILAAECGQRILERFLILGGQILGIENILQDLRMLVTHVGEELFLIICDLCSRDIHQVALGDCINDAHLKLDRNRGIAILLEHLHDALTHGKALLGIGIQVGAELGECLELAVLGIGQLQGAGHLLHGLDLRSRAGKPKCPG